MRLNARHPLAYRLLRELRRAGYDPRRVRDPARIQEIARDFGIELLSPPARPAG